MWTGKELVSVLRLVLLLSLSFIHFSHQDFSLANSAFNSFISPFLVIKLSAVLSTRITNSCNCFFLLLTLALMLFKWEKTWSRINIVSYQTYQVVGQVLLVL